MRLKLTYREHMQIPSLHTQLLRTGAGVAEPRVPVDATALCDPGGSGAGSTRVGVPRELAISRPLAAGGGIPAKLAAGSARFGGEVGGVTAYTVKPVTSAPRAANRASRPSVTTI